MPTAYLAALALFALAAPARAQAVRDAFLQWAATEARPVESVEAGPRDADLRSVRAMVGAARVVLFGEPAHGAHEPLAFRNRLFRHLVADLGFTAFALESGLAESRHVDAFVNGAPGSARDVARESLSYGFGTLAENVELIQWARDWNADPSHTRKIRFYGIDVSFPAPDDSTGFPRPLVDALAYLARVDSAAAVASRGALAPYAGRFSDEGYAARSAIDRDVLTATLEDLIALLERERPAYVARSSAADYAWALRDAVAARQLDRVFRVTPPGTPARGVPPQAWRAASARDAAMADNVRWVLGREGPAGRVFVFAHNAHVKNAATTGGIWDAFARPPHAMGEYLRTALGDAVLIVGTSAARDGDGLPPAWTDATSVDAVLARVGPPRFLLDVRGAGAAGAGAWLRAPQKLRANYTTFLRLSPGPAFDAMFFVDTLTPAHATPPGECKEAGYHCGGMPARTTPPNGRRRPAPRRLTNRCS